MGSDGHEERDFVASWRKNKKRMTSSGDKSSFKKTKRTFPISPRAIRSPLPTQISATRCDALLPYPYLTSSQHRKPKKMTRTKRPKSSGKGHSTLSKESLPHSEIDAVPGRNVCCRQGRPKGAEGLLRPKNRQRMANRRSHPSRSRL